LAEDPNLVEKGPAEKEEQYSSIPSEPQQAIVMNAKLCVWVYCEFKHGIRTQHRYCGFVWRARVLCDVVRSRAARRLLPSDPTL